MNEKSFSCQSEALTPTVTTYRDDNDEHEGGHVGVPQLLGLLGLAFSRGLLATVEQSFSLLLSLLHGLEEQDVENDERDAGDQVDEKHSEPETRQDQFDELMDHSTVSLFYHLVFLSPPST